MAAKSRPDSLAAYNAKRDFSRSPEPGGRVKRSRPKAAMFCVQQHLASHLHYDFRLEHNGVLLSWAVPKGPSLNPADKRMAVHVEDHPVDYGGFEGVIPDGYGAGVVLLWDRGTWKPDPATADVDAALAKGELKFSLDGVKLKGSWVLVRTKRQAFGGRGEQWLLIKHRDRWAGEVDVTELRDSVKSFGDLAGVLKQHGTPATWASSPPAKGGDAGRMFKQIMATAADKARPPAAAAKRPLPRPTGRKPVPLLKTPSAGRRATITNRDKVLFPKTGFTKGDLIDYYARIAPLMLPHLAGRAVTFKRFPDGVDGKSFFEKRCPAHRPEWVQTVRVPGETARDKSIDYCAIESVEALRWAANLAAIELHVPLALAAAPDTPTAMIIDLDPGPPADLHDCARVALRLKGLLDEMGLASMPKTSGGKGLHVLVPLSDATLTFARTKAFAKAIARTLERDDPEHVTAAMNKAGRANRVFIDWGQNDRDKTNAAVFSVRARDVPSVSWPLTWEQVAKGPAMRLASPTKPEIRSATKALEVLRTRQTLPEP